ncbi:MAG: c-type cytochrome, partial [Thermodesulfobacteriota bacterium]
KEEKMPGFNLSQDEIMALTEFLLSSRDKSSINAIEGEGDYDKGRGLFRQSRCISCHSINGRGGVLASELGNVANKVKKEWLLRYLKDVHHYQPRIKMLQYHFTDQNILDIAEYMMEEFYSEDGAVEEWDEAGEEDIEEEVVDDLDSEPKKTAVSEDKQQGLISKGKTLYINYGCYDCHDLSGIGTRPKVGPVLMTIGSKIVENLDFGNVNNVERSIENYIFLKIKTPDLFNDKAKMPQYHLSDEELIKMTIALLSFTNEEIPLEYIVREERHIKFNPHGQFGFLFRNYRCFSCHEVFGEGGELSTAPIDIYGSQLKKDWLFNYLKKPYAVRPSVTPRMPRFRMTDQEAQYMTDYITAVFTDDSIPEDFEKQFLPDDIERGKELFEENGCIACHILGKSGGYIGPQFNTVGDRLKPGWIFKWLLNPQLYKADTISPNYGLSEDEARALAAYLSSMKQVEE